jgi:glycosyltransferase involved in cell wall biosynthesis
MAETKKLRVLWIANSPGLSAAHLKMQAIGSGWIPALQEAVQEFSDCELGLAFYLDQDIAPFQLDKTWFFPVKKLANTREKRFLFRLGLKTEYDENIPAFLKVIESFKPDIIHIHGTEAPFGLLVRRISSIPIAISLQGILTAYEKKYFSGIQKPRRMQQLLSGYPFFLTDYKIWLKRAKIEQEILSQSQFVFGRTDWDRRICRIMAPNSSYFHLDEVIRKEFYRIHWKPTGNSVPILFTTSSPSFYKGFEMIIDAALILSKKGVRFVWKIAGLNEDDAFVKLVKATKKIDNLKSLHIELLGSLSEKELPEQFLQSDVYVQVSHIENSPNSLCEAMLAGMPIIASFAGGTSSLVTDKKNGILFQAGDPYVLAGCIDEMIYDSKKFLPMAEDAYRVAHQRHDRKRIVNELMDLYLTIIAQKKALVSSLAEEFQVVNGQDL